MKRDPKAEADRWLAQAEEEYKDAELLMRARRYYLSLYLCQQSAEKALKAYIYFKEQEPVFSHSIAVLANVAAALDPDFEALDSAKRLDDYYIPTRYPNGLPGDIPSRYYNDEDEVKRALALSGRVLELAKRKITG
jgi:HEPN domain-containing protein